MTYASYVRLVMRDDQTDSKQIDERPVDPVNDGHPLPAWRLTQTELRELANQRTRSYQGEVAWRADVD